MPWSSCSLPKTSGGVASLHVKTCPQLYKAHAEGVYGQMCNREYLPAFWWRCTSPCDQAALAPDLGAKSDQMMVT